MQGFDLFHFFRFLLTTIVCTYGVLKVISFIWGWQSYGADGRLSSALLRRYVIVLLLRMRLRRFFYEFAVIAVFVSILVLLLRLHFD